MPESEWSRGRGCRMRVETPATCVYLDEPLSGIAHFESMSTRDIDLSQLGVSLRTVSTGDRVSEVIFEELLRKHEVLPSLQSRAYPFSLTLPLGSTLEKAEVTARVGLGAFWNASASVPVLVAPQRSIARVVELLAEVSRHSIALWSDGVRDNGMIVADLRPKLEVEELFFGISVVLGGGRDGITGSVRVTPRGTGLMRLIPPTASIHPFRFSNPDPATMRQEFERIVLPIINDLQRLPIPAHSNVVSEHLPIPVGSEADDAP